MRSAYRRARRRLRASLPWNRAVGPPCADDLRRYLLLRVGCILLDALAGRHRRKRMRTCYARRRGPDILKPDHPHALGRGRYGENKQPAEQGDPVRLARRFALAVHPVGPISGCHCALRTTPRSVALLPLPLYPDLDFSRVNRVRGVGTVRVAGPPVRPRNGIGEIVSPSHPHRANNSAAVRPAGKASGNTLLALPVIAGERRNIDHESTW